MKTVTFTEFRQNASHLFSEVEDGEVVVVLRHGKAIAEVGPAAAADPAGPAWRGPGLRLAVKGRGLAAAILGERERADVL